MVTATITLACIMAYGACAGLTCMLMKKLTDHDEDDVLLGICASIWPIYLPALAAYVVTGKIIAKTCIPRAKDVSKDR